MKTIEEVQQDIIKRFSKVEDWLDKYEILIKEGAAQQPLPVCDKTDENLIDGCQNKVWVKVYQNKDMINENDKRVFIDGESEAMIVTGIMSLVIAVLDGRTPEEILNADLHFIKDIGLTEHLSPTRSNGVNAMIKRIMDDTRKLL